jgi:GNAT superfamily N-acetyltransferase
MRVAAERQCADAAGYRAARVKSLFNVDDGSRFQIEAELPADTQDWSVGLIVGRSGSGKTTLGRELWGGEAFYEPEGWPADRPIIEAISPGRVFDDVVGALSAVGLGTVPSWLRPYHVLSNGERFRADLARVVCEAPRRVVIDEFTSVVDRQIAKIGAAAFAKAWRRTGGQAVLLSCHYDIIDWVCPDWVYDLTTGALKRRRLRRRPDIKLDIHKTNWRHWPLFEEHHYLKLPRMIAAFNYVGSVGGQLVAHVAVSTRPGLTEGRACRLVVMPEWQGAGVGMAFLNAVCDLWRRGKNHYRKPMPVLFHTSHPGLAAALRRSGGWDQVSCALWGGSSERRSTLVKGKYGGHFRAVQGFRYFGE